MYVPLESRAQRAEKRWREREEDRSDRLRRERGGETVVTGKRRDGEEIGGAEYNRVELKLIE